MARPTLADIARASGVTTGAVSLILRHKGRFASTTRERVLAAAQRLQYRPDPVLASLRTGKFKKPLSAQATPVALLWNLGKPVLGRAATKAESLGYKLTAYDLAEYANPRRLGDVLYARGVRGVILSQLYAKETLPDLGWDRFACVCVARPFFPVPFDIVRDKVTEPFVYAFRRCLELGYRRIGLDAMIHRCWDRRHPDDRLRHAAALYCHTLIPKSDRVPIHFGRTKESESFIKWYRRHRPEVVIGCGSDRYFQLVQHGVDVPQETAFCALRLNDRSPPHVAGWTNNQEQLQEKAMEILDFQIRHNQLGPLETPTEHSMLATWREGPTLPGSAALNCQPSGYGDGSIANASSASRDRRLANVKPAPRTARAAGLTPPAATSSPDPSP